MTSPRSNEAPAFDAERSQHLQTLQTGNAAARVAAIRWLLTEGAYNEVDLRTHGVEEADILHEMIALGWFAEPENQQE